MKKAFIKFNSITYAQLAKEALLKYSIRSTMGRMKNSENCGYILYPNCEINRAYKIITDENIKNMGVGSGDISR